MTPTPVSTSRKDQVEFLVAFRFPELKGPPTLMALARAGGFEALHAADAYRNELAALTDEDIASLVVEAQKEADGGRPHSHPSAKSPDYDLWTKHAYWTVDEMVALALGRDPAVVSWSMVKRELDRGSAFAKRYATLREIVGRAVATGQLNRTAGPLEFMAWADWTRLELPAGLSMAIKALRAHGVRPDPGNHQALADEVRGLKATIEDLTEKNRILAQGIEGPEADKKNELAPRERESLLKIVLAVAIKKYNFDVNASKNSTASNLARTLDEYDLSLDPDTIRRYLQEAKSLFSDRLPRRP